VPFTNLWRWWAARDRRKPLPTVAQSSRQPDVSPAVPLPAYEPPESMRDPELAAKFPIAQSGLALAVSFIYLRHGNGQPERRTVTVRAIRVRSTRGGRKHMYLDGYCHDCCAPRMFRCDQIGELTDLRAGEILTGEAAILDWVGEAALGVPRERGKSAAP